MDESRDDLWGWLFFLLVAIGIIAAWLPQRGILGLLLTLVLLLQILLGSLWILCGVVVGWAVLEDDRLARFEFEEKAMLVIAGPLTLALLASCGIPEWLAKMWLPLRLKCPETKQNQGALPVDRAMDQISETYLKKVEELLRR